MVLYEWLLPITTIILTNVNYGYKMATVVHGKFKTVVQKHY
jgi:hypothetical protein